MHVYREIESLEIHRRIARCLEKDHESVLTRARENLRRRIRARPSDGLSGVYREWEAILSKFSPTELAAFLVSDDPDAVRLRQSSPFAGVLSPGEIWEIKRERRHATT